MTTQPFTILRIDASARTEGSASRALADRAVRLLTLAHPGAKVVRRDLAAIPPTLLTEAMIGAFFTPEDQRTEDQRALLTESDTLVAELQAADHIVIAVPIYNFGVPGAFKAWYDLVARAKLTFRYTPDGPVGLLADRPVTVVVASGGTAVGSEIDFATGWLKHGLGFIGLHDVRLIAADRLMADPARKDAAEQALEASVAG